MAAASRDHRKGKGQAGKKGATSNGKGQSSARLPWKPVPLPLEAVASGGQSDADFFQGLNFDDDDYMGIKEVEGVEVLKKDDGTLALVAQKDDKGKAREELVQQVKSKSTSKDASRGTAARGLDLEAKDGEEDGSSSDSGSASATEDTEEAILSDVDFEDGADEDDVGDAQDQDHKADFRLLMRNDEDKADVQTWSKKTHSEWSFI